LGSAACDCNRMRPSGRLHVEIARVAVAGLVLSSATALWVTASTFDLLPNGSAAPAIPVEVSGKTGIPVGAIDLLNATPVAELRELSFPYPGEKFGLAAAISSRIARPSASSLARRRAGTASPCSWARRSSQRSCRMFQLCSS